jgi:hypothetical protein
MPTLNLGRLGNELTRDNWNAKSGKAAEFNSQGHNYRVWKPDVTVQGNGLYISCKLDHIRGWGSDDHASIELNINDKGEPENVNTSIKFAGKGSFITGLILPTELIAALSSWVNSKTGDSGRRNFPFVVHHTVNRIVECVVI